MSGMWIAPSSPQFDRRVLLAGIIMMGMVERRGTATRAQIIDCSGIQHELRTSSAQVLQFSLAQSNGLLDAFGPGVGPLAIEPAPLLLSC